MNLLQTSTIASGRRMQWVCGAEVVDEALAVAAELARSYGIGVDLWRIDDWAGMAQDGIACERRWREGDDAAVVSRFEQLMAPTQGAILAITRGPRDGPGGRTPCRGLSLVPPLVAAGGCGSSSGGGRRGSRDYWRHHVARRRGSRGWWYLAWSRHFANHHRREPSRFCYRNRRRLPDRGGRGVAWGS